MFSRSLFFGLCVAIIFPWMLCAQPQQPSGLDPYKDLTQYIHKVWQTEQGLPQNSAYALCQTRDGYLWIGTAEGLARYDGVRFTVFDKTTTPALASNWISSLAEGSDGRLWIGTRLGVVCLHKGVFQNYSSRGILPATLVRSLLLDSKGGLWVGTNGSGLHYLAVGGVQSEISATSTTTQDSIVKASIKREGLSGGVVLSLVQATDGAIWIGTQSSGLYRLQNGVVTRYGVAEGLPNVAVRTLLADRDGRTLWIGAFDGLYCLQNGKVSRYIGKNAFTGNKSIQCLLQDRTGTLWIGSYGGGVHRLRDGVFAEFTTAQGLSNDIVQSLLQDREGSLWIGTFGGGLNRFHDGAFTTYTPKQGLSNKFVNAVLRDERGVLWAATNGGGVSRMESGVFTKYTTKEGLLNDVTASLLSHNGNLWIGTAGGLNRLQNGRLTHYTMREGLSHNSVWTMLHDSDTKNSGSVIWCGTQNGLNRFQNGTFTHYTTKNGLSNNVVLCLRKDRNISIGDSTSALWIGTQDGLNKLHNGNGVITQYTTRDGLSSNFIWTMLQEADGTLWLGTSAGLNRFKNGVFTAFTTKNGMFDDLAFSILEDDLGYFWMSCNKGVYRVRKADLNDFADGKRPRISCEVFGTADGMASAECNGGSPSAWKDSNGCLWFATIAGVAMVNPRALHMNPVPPTVILESIKADSMELSVQWNDTLSAENAHSAIIIPPHTEKFEFRYTATSLVVPERVRFKYMLEGYDKDWTDAGTRRVAYYNNLPRGREYRFRVQACNNSDVWSNDDGGAEATFSLKLYFYETWWFLLAYAVVLVVVLAWAVRSRLRILQKRAGMLENAVQDRTRELAQTNEELYEKNQQLEMLNIEKNELLGIVSHDLKNPIGAVRGLAELLQSGFLSEEQASGTVAQIMATSDRMLDLVKNLLDINRLESGGMQFWFVEFDVAAIVSGGIAIHEQAAAAKDITLHYSNEASRSIIFADEQAVMQVMDNLLSNAVKYSHHGKDIFVRLLSNERAVRVEVRDEGEGISEADMTKLFGKFARLSARPTGGEHSTGLGLSIVKKMVEAMNGRVWCESEAGKGATFIVEFLVIS